ncbi:hypothetical protein COOONC_03041, partial [Cooperia oncophora]
MIKVVSMKDSIGGYDHVYDRAEKFCQKEGSHLTSIRSEDELGFISGHYFIINFTMFISDKISWTT